MRLFSKLRIVAGLLTAVIILAGAGDDSTRVEKLGHQMMCICGACNQYLLDCNHVGCAYSSRMRVELRAAVDNGKDDSSILRSFVEEYGAVVLAAPTKTGFDRVAWLLPYLALILGIGIVIVALRTLSARVRVGSRQAGAAQNASDLDRFRAQARKDTEL